MEQLTLLTSKYFIILIVLFVWTIPWKGFALWKSARRGENIWFIILLIVNTLSILEILYIFVFSQKERGENNSGARIIKRNIV